MRLAIIVGFLAAVGAVVYTFQSPKTEIPAGDDGRITTVDSEKLIEFKNEKLTADGTNNQLTEEERTIIRGRTTTNFPQDTLILLAEIFSPNLNGQTLQASDIFVKSDLTRKMIYVSYSMKGEPFIGGLQVIQITTKKTGVLLKLLQTVLFNDFDIHSLTEKNNILYLAGATNDPRFKTPAAIEIIRLKNGLLPRDFNSTRIDLPSFAATSVIKVTDKLYVATGNKDGGILEISEPEKVSSNFSYYKEHKHKLYDLDDARDLDYNEDYIFAVRGTNAGLWVLDRKSPSPTPLMMDLEGATIPESKSTIEVAADKIILGLGDGGTQILKLSDLSLWYQIPQATHNSNDHSLAVTNAASGQFKELYTADGESGMRIFDLNADGTYNQVGQISFGAGKSVNAIKYFDGYLIIASGLGGLKIAKMYRADEEIEGREHAYYTASENSRMRDD